MQPVKEQDLKQFIKEAKAEGKGVDGLEKALSKIKNQVMPKAEIKKIKTRKGTIVIQSTGPARNEDFEI